MWLWSHCGQVGVFNVLDAFNVSVEKAVSSSLTSILFSLRVKLLMKNTSQRAISN